MDEFERIRRQLMGLDTFSEYARAADLVRDVYDNLSMVRPEMAAWKMLEDERIKHLGILGLDSSVGAIERHAQELAIADAANLAQSYRLMTGNDFLAGNQYATQQELLDQVLGASSAAATLTNAFHGLSVPSSVLQVIDDLNYAKRFLGEFEYSSGFSSSPEAVVDNAEAEKDEETLETRKEVEARIIQSGYFSAKVFNELSNEPELLRGLYPRAFEELTAEVLDRLGFQGIQLTPRSGDGGRDIVAIKEVNDIPIVMAFECKKYSEKNKIGLDIMRSLLGTIMHGPTRASMGVIVTTSSFTSGAKKFIATEATIDGKDFDALVKWLQDLRGGS